MLAVWLALAGVFIGVVTFLLGIWFEQKERTKTDNFVALNRRHRR